LLPLLPEGVAVVVPPGALVVLAGFDAEACDVPSEDPHAESARAQAAVRTAAATAERRWLIGMVTPGSPVRCIGQPPSFRRSFTEW
jgi:hypothetical protein